MNIKCVCVFAFCDKDSPCVTLELFNVTPTTTNIQCFQSVYSQQPPTTTSYVYMSEIVPVAELFSLFGCHLSSFRVSKASIIPSARFMFRALLSPQTEKETRSDMVGSW